LSDRERKNNNLLILGYIPKLKEKFPEMSISSSAEEAMKSGYITGLHTDTGKIEPRLEIDEFVLDRDVLNIFLLALINLQGRNYDDPWSWFQIAGKQPGG
jgi:hypothetical protein